MTSLVHSKAASNRKAPSTKAGWLYQTLYTESDFSIAYLNAVLANDTDALAGAFEIIDMYPSDAEISKEEYLAFIRGHTPSGELEVTAWGGYYVTDPLSDGRVFALFIRSSNNRVYWGLEPEFANKYWSDSEVNYTLKNDGTLHFSSSAGDVILSFSNDFDQETGEVSGIKVKGTIGNLNISAVPTVPPIPPPLDTSPVATASSFRQQIKPSVPTTSIASDTSLESHNFLFTDEYKTFFAIIGLYNTGRALINWVAPAFSRYLDGISERLGRQIEHLTPSFLGVLESRFSYTYVDLSVAQKKLTEEVTQKLNEEMRNRGVDIDNKTPEQIIDELDLKELASEQLERFVNAYLQDRLDAIVRRQKREVPADLEKVLRNTMPKWVREMSDARTGRVVDNFRPNSTPIGDLVKPVVWEQYKELYQKRVDGYTTDLNAINDAIRRTEENIDRAYRTIDRLQQELDALQDEAEKEKLRDDIRREQLKVDVEIGIKASKEAERKETEGKKTDADEKRTEHDNDIKEYKGYWEEDMKRHLKY